VSNNKIHPTAAIAIDNVFATLFSWSASVAEPDIINGIKGVDVAVLVAVLVCVEATEVVAVVVGVVVGDVELVDGVGITQPVCLPVHTVPFNRMIATQHCSIPPSIVRQSPPPHCPHNAEQQARPLPDKMPDVQNSVWTTSSVVGVVVAVDVKVEENVVGAEDSSVVVVDVVEVVVVTIVVVVVVVLIEVVLIEVVLVEVVLVEVVLVEVEVVPGHA